MTPRFPVANVLPQTARDALIKAANTAPSAADPLRRQKAIEKATQRIKQQHPDLFHLPKEIES